MRIGIAECLRLRSVMRWHLIGQMRPQTVADHTFGVMVVADRLLTKMMESEEIKQAAGDVFGAGMFRQSLLLHVLYHDAEEAILGDIPSPTKTFLERAGRGCVSNTERMVEVEGRRPYTMPVDDLLKICDLFESISYLSRYHSLKDSQIEAAEASLTAILDKRVKQLEATYRLPEESLLKCVEEMWEEAHNERYIDDFVERHG